MKNLKLHTLGASTDSIEVLRPRVFGILADIAWPVVNNYRSDLYHDAMWLNENLSVPDCFYFAVDKSGTSIGTASALVSLRCNSRDSQMFQVWLVIAKSMRSNLRYWELQIEEYTEEEISDKKLEVMEMP